MITQSELKKFLHYDPKTGIFTRLFTVCKNARKGVIKNKSNPAGYIPISIKGKQCYAHRLAWLYSHGEWPEEIDHINHNPSDNRLVNLRNVDKKHNARNCPMKKSNKSGFTGVWWVKRIGKWGAGIQVDRDYIKLGHYDDINDAIDARKKANKEYEFHSNHGKPKRLI